MTVKKIIISIMTCISLLVCMAITVNAETETVMCSEEKYSDVHYTKEISIEDIRHQIENPTINQKVTELYQEEYPGQELVIEKGEEYFNFNENGAVNLEVEYVIKLHGKEIATHIEYIEVAPNVSNAKKKYKERTEPKTKKTIEKALAISKKSTELNKRHESSYKMISEEERAKILERKVLIKDRAKKLIWIVLILIGALGVWLYKRVSSKKKKKKLKNSSRNRSKLNSRCIVLLVLISTLLVQVTTANAEHIWRYNRNRTGYVPKEMMLPYRLTKTVTGYGASDSTPVMVGDDELYVTDTVKKTIGRIELDGANSSTVWKTRSGTYTGGANNGAPYGNYFVLANNNILQVRNKSDGSLYASATMADNTVNDPLIVGNHVYVTTVYRAANGVTGKIQRFTLPGLTGRVDYTVSGFSGHVTSVRCAPTYIADSDRIAIVSNGVNSNAINANREGEIIVLNRNLSLVGKEKMIAGAIATPVYYNNKLYVHDYRGHVYRANKSGKIEAVRRRPHDGKSNAIYYSAQSSGATNGSHYFWPIKTRSGSYTSETGIFKVPLNFSSGTNITAYKKGTWPTSSLTISKTNRGDTIFYVTNDNYFNAIYASNGSNNTHAFFGGNWRTSVSGAGNFSSPTINGGVGGYMAVMSSGGVRLFTTDDATAPQITASPSSRGWNTSDASTNITVKDLGNTATVGLHRIWTVRNNSSSTPSVSSSVWGSPKYTFSNFKESQSWSETWSANGSHYVHVKATDRLGNVRTATFGPYRVDKTAPSVNINPNSRTGWSNQDAHYTISVSDSGGSGLYRWRARYENNGSWGSWYPYETMSAKADYVTAEGPRRVQIEAYDNAGNKTTYTSGYYNIDKTAPTVTANPSSRDWGSGDASTTISITDSLSGIRDVWTITDNNSSMPADSDSRWENKGAISSVKQTFSNNGSNYIHVWARDKAGNITRKTFGPFKVDKVAPTVSASPESSGWDNEDKSTTISISDSHSGIRDVWTIKDNSSSMPADGDSRWVDRGAATGITETFSDGGNNYIHVWARDKAGNITRKTFGPYRIDKTKPIHTSHSIVGHRYRNRNDYWIRANDRVKYKMRGYDSLGGIRYSYARLVAPGVDARSMHDWNAADNHNHHFMKSEQIEFVNAARTYNSGGYREIEWTIDAKTYENDFDVQYYYRDNANNNIGYLNTGMRLRVDTTKPVVTIDESSGDIIPSDKITITASDSGSGLKHIYYKWSNSINRPSSWIDASSLIANNKAVVPTSPYGSSDRMYLHYYAEDQVGNVTVGYAGVYNVVDDTVSIDGLALVKIVNPPIGAKVPVIYPISVPPVVNAGYKLDFITTVTGADELEIKLYDKGKQITLYTDEGAKDKLILPVESHNKSSVRFTFWVDKEMKEGTVLDMEIILKRSLPKDRKTLVGNTELGRNCVIIGGSSKKDSRINLTR